MATYLPPTEELPIFDNQVFDVANNTALTYAEAKKYFVSFPIAQGTSTITDLITGEISYQSPASGSTFEIGTNQVSGGTIKIGPTGGTAGVSVHCANLDFKNNGINNATSNAGGDVSLASLQTSGTLNIGTAVRTAPINIGNNTSALNSGGVNIGSRGVSGTGGGPVNLYGTTIDINCANITTAPMTLSTYVNNPITIGAAGNLNLNSTNAGIVNLGTSGTSSISIGSLSSPTTPTTINGTLTNTGMITALNGITLESGKYITTTLSSSTVTAPSSPTQVGCVISGVLVSSPTLPTSDNVTSYATITLKAGTWVITVNRQLNSTTGTSKMLFSFGSVLRNNVAQTAGTDYLYGLSSVPLSSTGVSFGSFTTIISLTAGDDTIVYFNITPTYSTAFGTTASNFKLTATRIA